MNVLQSLIGLLGGINARVLRWGRGIGAVAMALMVAAVLLQIFYRYVLNNALPWPEEAARALMIWMMALVAPSAYRYAGFVSIDMLPDLLPPRIRALLMLAIMGLSLIVMIVMLGHAWAHFSAPLLFDSSGLNRLLQDSGINQLLGTELQFRTAYVYLAMSVLMVMLISVSVELILRAIGRLIWSDEDFPAPQSPMSMVGD
ncbi:TRAP transporter small permease [Pseudahrensia aquimaris]|uniref:TRAP transporter small permease protein n=1 Tax=Pseudahrensia aquimaris TaxID=744461 RepID=A0ABW3FGA9_9HYPH